MIQADDAVFPMPQYSGEENTAVQIGGVVQCKVECSAVILTCQRGQNCHPKAALQKISLVAMNFAIITGKRLTEKNHSQISLTKGHTRGSNITTKFPGGIEPTR